MFSCYRIKSCFNLRICVESRLFHKVVQPLAVERPFHFREHSFDLLEFRTVPDVPNRLHVQLRPPLFDARLLVDACIVHVQWNRPLSYFSAELLEVVTEVFASARLFVNLDQANPMFFRHACDHWTKTDVYIFLIHGQIRVFLRPLSEFDWSFRKKYLVDVDYQATFSFGLFNVFHQTSALLTEVLSRLFGYHLLLPYVFASNPIL